MKNSKYLTTTLTLATLLIAGNALARVDPNAPMNPAIQVNTTPVLLDPTVKPIELPTGVTPTGPTVELPEINPVPVPLPNISVEGLDPEETEPKEHKKKLARLMTRALKNSALGNALKDVGDTMEAEDKAKLEETMQGVMELQPGSFKNKKGGLKDGPKGGQKPAHDVAEDSAEIVE